VVNKRSHEELAEGVTGRGVTGWVTGQPELRYLREKNLADEAVPLPSPVENLEFIVRT
jgi:hypothetical protein